MPDPKIEKTVVGIFVLLVTVTVGSTGKVRVLIAINSGCNYGLKYITLLLW